MLFLFDLKEEYEDEEEEEEEAADGQKQAIDSKFEHALEEEDPEVIKELIMLIKKVGGLDELEKQLQMRLNLNQNSPVVSKTTTTTISPISQSLYNKVVGTKRGNLRTQKVINSGGTTSGSEIEPLVQRQNKENRYSSVIRNSRPRPQNDGIDQLSETDGGGIARGEKPQYTTITRTHAPKTQNSDDDGDDEPAVATAATNLDQTDETTASHHSTYQYVNIQRPRVSTTASPDDSDDENANGNTDNDDTEDDDEEETSKVLPTTTSKMQYVNIQRVRPTKPQYLADEESETPEPETK